MGDNHKHPHAPPEAPEIDERVKVVSYLDRDGDPQVRECQDFLVVAEDAHACAILWLGDIVARNPEGITRQGLGRTHGILEWELEYLPETWQEHIRKL